MSIGNLGVATRGEKIKLKKDLGESIKAQYQNNEDIIFTCIADGVGNSYEWEYFDGKVWKTYADQTQPQFRLDRIPLEYSGMKFRCKVTNSLGSTYSDEVVLTVKKPTSKPIIIQQPVSITKSARNISHVLQDKVAKIVVSG